MGLPGAEALLSIEQLLDVDIDSLPDAGWRSAALKRGASRKSSSDGKMKREQKLRPLAHLSIRDQTLATAVMLALQMRWNRPRAIRQSETAESAKGRRFQLRQPFALSMGLTTSPSPRAHFGWETHVSIASTSNHPYPHVPGSSARRLRRTVVASAGGP